MTWLPLLLADRSPCLRWLVLTELMGRDENDVEVQELAALREQDPLVAPLLAVQEADGGWRHGDPAWQGGGWRITALALMRLGYLGFGPESVAVRPCMSENQDIPPRIHVQRGLNPLCIINHHPHPIIAASTGEPPPETA